ncbi:haloacid dehalogenase-like hydrolase [Seminavis robusta]|uniref:Haloacid dehalogenase-like hydrolase n=1 Tax=Seminavis robusta TaxID=568900 RepID=A0A9N8D6P2_9STRA|nr:haloacid dehalogenase-like hydrolase [Seminavis robusta]|eukprot:Sro19_g013280.1 haloacid dehalogenase-like hydrolase (320) ;mRNA; r:27150-28109
MMKQPLIPKELVLFEGSQSDNDPSFLCLYENKMVQEESAQAAAAAFVKRLRDSPTTPKMVVFDKDGTLGDCTASLRRWVHHMTAKVESVLKHKNLTKQFHTQIGWDAARDNVVPSAPVAAGTWDDIVGLVYSFLMDLENEWNVTIITKELTLQWHEELGDLHGQDTPLMDDLPGMMRACQELGYTVAICTSDDRNGTDKAMKGWGIDNVVQFSICGNEVSQGKPSAVPLQTLCQQVSAETATTILPQHCIVVGDTSSDTGMARAANAGFCVGVLTGSGTTSQLLDTGAHLILPDVGHVPELLETFQRLADEARQQQVHQ